MSKIISTETMRSPTNTKYDRSIGQIPSWIMYRFRQRDIVQPRPQTRADPPIAPPVGGFRRAPVETRMSAVVLVSGVDANRC